MNSLIQQLAPRARRGSKPRCHLLTHGSTGDVAAKLTALVAPHAHVSDADRWMPQGFTDMEEAQLHKAPRLLPTEIGRQLGEWWLAPKSVKAMTPNFDIASTCMVGGKPGLLLIEAKAHDEELHKEIAGRKIAADTSEDRRASHSLIGASIETARKGLEHSTSLQWHISRDSHYQMSNRFAWSWKLVEQGIPVVLIYLGFLRANEMQDRGCPFESEGDWSDVVLEHSAKLFPESVWNRAWQINGTTFVPLIRSVEVDLNIQVNTN